MKKNYVSNSRESVRIFENDILESLSKVHVTVPLLIYVPLIIFFVVRAISLQIAVLDLATYFLFGFITWTATEYLLHRFIFHYKPTSKWGQRLHFIFHGVHHDYPKDVKRLVMPPSASIPLATGFYFLFSSFVTEKTLLSAFFSGFIFGYLIYDMMHYAMHHYNFKSNLMKKMKQHHMLHHYDDPTKGYGVSSVLWDKVFQSGFPKKENVSVNQNC